MITINDQMTTGTLIDSLLKSHLLPVPTSATVLRCICRVNLNELSASLFRFARQLGEKSRPCYITYALCQTMIVSHPIDHQILNTDDTEMVNDLAAILMGKVAASELDTLVDTCHGLAMLAPFWRALFQFGMFALDFGKGFLFLAEKARILDFLTIREGRKGFQSDINTHGTDVFWESFRFDLTGEADIPFARAALADRRGLGSSSQVTMQSQLDLAYFGDHQFAIFERAATWSLWERQGIVTAFALKAGIARILSGFAASEEGFESQINSDSYILQDLRMDPVQRRTFLFQYHVCGLLLVAGQAFANLFIRLASFFQQIIVEPATFFQLTLQDFDLFLCGKQTILEHLKHSSYFSVNWTCCQVERVSLYPNRQIR